MISISRWLVQMNLITSYSKFSLVWRNVDCHKGNATKTNSIAIHFYMKTHQFSVMKFKRLTWAAWTINYMSLLRAIAISFLFRRKIFPLYEKRPSIYKTLEHIGQSNWKCTTWSIDRNIGFGITFYRYIECEHVSKI